MRDQQIEKALDAAIDGTVLYYDELWIYPWVEQLVLYELVRGEADDDLLRTLVKRLSWRGVVNAAEPDDDTWIETAALPGRVEWPRAVTRNASWASHEWPGLSPTLLREAAEHIERLVDAGLLQPVPRSAPGGGPAAEHIERLVDPGLLHGGGPAAYRLPTWLWRAFLEVVGRLSERSKSERVADADKSRAQ
jgi:hypothetical protein